MENRNVNFYEEWIVSAGCSGGRSRRLAVAQCDWLDGATAVVDVVLRNNQVHRRYCSELIGGG